MKHWNPDNIGYWVIGAGCKIKKDQELSHSPSNCSKDSSKLLPSGSLCVEVNSSTCLTDEYVNIIQKSFFWKGNIFCS